MLVLVFTLNMGRDPKTPVLFVPISNIQCYCQVLVLELMSTAVVIIIVGS